MKLIGIAGTAGSGKDTAAKFLNGYKRLAFADELKYKCMNLFGLTYDEVFINKDVKLNRKPFKEDITPRKILQYFGTDVIRNGLTSILENSDNFWINIIENKIEKDGSYVITDVRFKNEVDFIKKNGGIVVLIKRPGFENNNSHISENGIENYDVLIENNGTLEELKEKIEKLLL